jgi:hypothetical protein
MLRAISQLAKIDSLLAKVEGIKFNATLPVSIKIKEQTKPQEYLLDVGNKKELKTKSEVPLDVGKKYWGVLKQSPQTKSISLSHLLKQPIHLQSGKKSAMPNLKLDEFKTILESEKPKENLKFALLTKLSTATTKSEFLSLTNMLNAINENVFTFVLAQDQKETLFQFKKSKPKNKEEEDSDENAKVDFYAAFENLGPVEGVVEVIDGVRKLSLYLYYENSLKFLQKELDNLDIESFLYKKEGNISPLYEYGESLLDVKG